MKLRNEFDHLADNPELQRMVQVEDRKETLKQLHQIGTFSDFDEMRAFEKWLTEQKIGYQLPFLQTNGKFLITKNEMTLVSGYTGEGKSELVIQILLDCIDQGAKGFIASLELTPHELQKRILRQACGTVTPTSEYLAAFWKFYSDKLTYKDTRGIVSIDKILNGCRDLFEDDGTNVFVFDNLMMLDSATDNYNKQFENAQKISEFCKTYPVSVFLVAHSRKPSAKDDSILAGLPIKPPSIYHVHGASQVANLVDNHMSIAQNKNKEAAKRSQQEGISLSETQIKFLNEGDSIILRDKKREQGEKFKIHVYYDQKFSRFKDYEKISLKRYVDYSNQN